jgi:Bacteriophage Mu-like, Gp48
MAIPQPILPAEIDFTDPELNFLDESPRGFFPENQDSNWGYRRKVFSDVMWEIYSQLHLLYAEMFPATSQEFLDEWERMVGLPANPPNKSIGQRQQNVLNRLRGGPFTRTQRRLIVESYITATFGDALQILPPGIPMIVAGQKLYNEPGDVTQLYMILETVEQFKYEVRIKTGMAIDTVGLERDLRWYTPAGILPIFNYAWEGKFVSDSGIGEDGLGLTAGVSRAFTVFDSGEGREAIGQRGTDAGVGTDFGTRVTKADDTGTASAEIATVTKVVHDLNEGGVGIEDIEFRSVRQDTGTGFDFGKKDEHHEIHYIQ